MTKKEMREQASRNKSILDGTRKDRNIPEGSREENDCLDGPDGWTENDVKDSGPDGWMGTWDKPEEGRRARTTGGTYHLNISQEVKNVPEAWKEDAVKYDDSKNETVPNMMTNMRRSDYQMAGEVYNMEGIVQNIEMFDDRYDNDDLDRIIMNMNTENPEKKHEPEDSMKIEDDEFPDEYAEINFEEKV